MPRAIDRVPIWLLTLCVGSACSVEEPPARDPVAELEANRREALDQEALREVMQQPPAAEPEAPACVAQVEGICLGGGEETLPAAPDMAVGGIYQWSRGLGSVVATVEAGRIVSVLHIRPEGDGADERERELDLTDVYGLFEDRSEAPPEIDTRAALEQAIVAGRARSIKVWQAADHQVRLILDSRSLTEGYYLGAPELELAAAPPPERASPGDPAPFTCQIPRGRTIETRRSWYQWSWRLDCTGGSRPARFRLDMHFLDADGLILHTQTQRGLHLEAGAQQTFRGTTRIRCPSCRRVALLQPEIAVE